MGADLHLHKVGEAKFIHHARVVELERRSRAAVVVIVEDDAIGSRRAAVDGRAGRQERLDDILRPAEHGQVVAAAEVEIGLGGERAHRAGARQAQHVVVVAGADDREVAGIDHGGQFDEG